MSSGEGSENGMESHSDLSGEVTSSEYERKPGNDFPCSPINSRCSYCTYE